MAEQRHIEWQITNGRLVGAGGAARPGGIVLRGGRIAKILGPATSEPELLNLNLHGLPVLPGLINAYDALPATFYPFSGVGRPYRSWVAWDNELKSSALFKERMLLELEDLYRLGGYRNLASGVTTVLDHVPHFLRQAAPDDMAVTLLAEFGISHSVGGYSLGWGDGPAVEYARAAQSNRPYVTRIAEGFDAESRGALAALDLAGALGERTVLAHGVALSSADFARIADVGASIVWCPESDLHLYGMTLSVHEALAAGVTVCLGSDSAMSGSVNLATTLRAASGIAGPNGERLGASDLYRMVTENSARALCLPEAGVVRQGAVADLVVLRAGESADPLAALIAVTPADLYLVVRGGIPEFGDAELEPVFTQAGVLFDRITINGRSKIIRLGVKKLLETISAALGYTKEFPFLPAL